MFLELFLVLVTAAMLLQGVSDLIHAFSDRRL